MLVRALPSTDTGVQFQEQELYAALGWFSRD